ncbi:MAG: hypothetical protein O2960_02355 [Verrucomicrobia bacterium]|nr:hypothetical protein [Verrucomicrobiota bacterium]
MPDSYSLLQRQRSVLLGQMAALDRMERGRLSEQFLKGEKDGRPVTRGPYYVLQRRLGQQILKERDPPWIACPASKRTSSVIKNLSFPIHRCSGDREPLPHQKRFPGNKANSRNPLFNYRTTKTTTRF